MRYVISYKKVFTLYERLNKTETVGIQYFTRVPIESRTIEPINYSGVACDEIEGTRAAKGRMGGREELKSSEYIDIS